MHVVVGDAVVSLPLLALVGLVIGFIAGMFGIGGGFVLTPALHLVFKMPMPIAVGSALCQKIGTSVGSFLKHRQYRHGEIRVDFVMLGGSIFGVDAGTRLLAWLSAAGSFQNARGHMVPIVTLVIECVYATMLLFAASMTLNAARKAARKRQTDAVYEGPAPLVKFRLPPELMMPVLGAEVSAPVMAYIGFFTGLLSGLLGIGGGVALLPILIYGYGFSLKDAAGTGILLLFATVTVGTFEHALRGNVDLHVALAILAGSSIGSQLGARATARLPSQVMRLSFAALLLATVGAIGFDVLRSMS
jgi:uncharacterized protein